MNTAKVSGYAPWFLLLVFAWGHNLAADQWSTPEEREFRSENGRFVFRVSPTENPYKDPGRCLGTLSQVHGNERKEIWGRHLINNVAPLSVWVADSGEYVVTMDEWGHVGRLPLVIYGAHGALVEAHNSESLGLYGGSLHIKQTVSSFWWSEDSIAFFGPDDETFFIRLHWGKLLIINLRSGDLAQKTERSKIVVGNEKEWRFFQDYAEKRIKVEVLAYLKSENPHKRKTGAMVAGQIQLRQAIPRLRSLLDDASDYTQISGKIAKRIFYVRKEAKQALEAMNETVPKVVVETPEEKSKSD